METLKRNWLKAIAALTVVLGLALSVNAFEKKTEIKPNQTPIPTSVYFKLKSTQQSDIEQAGNWSDTPNGDCLGATYLCEVTYDAAVYPTLQDFLNANPTQSMIEANALNVEHRN